MHGNDSHEQDVPLDFIRHSDRRCYVDEGHGGREIDAWPVYRFFCEYLEGSPRRAEKDFADWYREQFSKYHDVPKRLGGMQSGSLHRTLVRIEAGKTDQRRRQTRAEGVGFVRTEGNLEDAIAVRVVQRFQLLERIREYGYIPDASDPVLGIQKRDGVYLEGGHHRAAALKALGWTVLPNVFVFQGELSYKLWQWHRAVAHAWAVRIRKGA